jgi:hypothetical protein
MMGISTFMEINAYFSHPFKIRTRQKPQGLKRKNENKLDGQCFRGFEEWGLFNRKSKSRLLKFRDLSQIQIARISSHFMKRFPFLALCQGGLKFKTPSPLLGLRMAQPPGQQIDCF